MRLLSRVLGGLLALLVVTGPASARVAVAAFALWGDQGVFRSEATGAAAVIAARYGAVRTVIRANSPARALAGPAAFTAALAEAGRGLDPASDVLVVILTSHGIPDGVAVKGGRVEGTLPPRALGALLARSPVVHKVVVVSACFSGIFTTLANPDTLVITAVDAGHPSFGCEAGAKWTYFGRAFFDQALRDAVGSRADLAAVFGHAADLVRVREAEQGFEPSNPQMAGGADVLRLLDGS